jgi:hypothetical protein
MSDKTNARAIQRATGCEFRKALSTVRKLRSWARVEVTRDTTSKSQGQHIREEGIRIISNVVK